MNQPPNDSYSNSSRRRKQVQRPPRQQGYSSPQKKGGYPNPPQRRKAQQGATPNSPKTRNFSGQASHLVPLPGGFAPTQRPKPSSTQSTWTDLTELPIKPKKLHRRLVDLITIAVVLTLIAGGIATYLNLFNTTSGPQIVNVVIPTQAVETPSTGIVDRPTQAGVWLITITHVQTATNHTLSDPNDIYIEINVTLKNTSATPQILVGLLEFLLEDNSSEKLHETLADPDIRQPADGDVAAGKTLLAQIAFEIPKSANNCTLNFHYGLVDNTTASVNWPITT